MSALKWIVSEAKKLKKAYPKRFATWREYVAQASAIYAKKHKGKSPVGKKRKVSGVKKKKVKKSTSHKDTKSHNVRISVVSGTFNVMNALNNEVKELKKYEQYLIDSKNLLKKDPKNERYKYNVQHYKRIIAATKRNINKLKRKL